MVQYCNMLPMCIGYYEYCVIFLCLDVILLSSTLSIDPIGPLYYLIVN